VINQTIPTITATNKMMHAMIDSPSPKPFFCNQKLKGKKSMESKPPKQRGTRNGLAKYNPATTKKRKSSTYTGFCKKEA
jgi:hypothetical protein